MDGTKYIGRGKSKKFARIEAAANALRDFIQFKDQQIKNGVIGINNHLLSSLTSASSANSNNLNNNLSVDFTSDDHIENTGILLNNLHSNINNNNDTMSNSSNSNTLEDENLINKIQQSLECFKTNTDINHALINRLQSKYYYLIFI